MPDLTKEETLAAQEYTEVSLNMRHYGNMHFAELTIFFAVNGAMLWSVAEKGASMPRVALLAAEVAGCLLCVLFYLMARDVVVHWDHLLARANELEKRLCFRQYSVPPPPRRLNNRRLIYGVYLVMFVLWVINFVSTVANQRPEPTGGCCRATYGAARTPIVAVARL